jgi:hypothetical protein
MDPTVAGVLIGAGGAAVVAVAGFWANARNTRLTTEVSRRAVEAAQRTVELTEQGQVTDRYAKAIEQLGSGQLEVRIGGIYALERIARDSPRDHPTIMEVLAAFIREHSREQWPPAEPGAEPAARTTRPDVQAAATVIGRRSVGYDSQPIDLRAASLARADLTGADLTGADLNGVDLTRANLADVNLAGANLFVADLTRANLLGVDLTRANLLGAYLHSANLTGADLTGASLFGASLVGANLTGADLTGVNLTRADLTRADLTETDLTGANLNEAHLTGAFWPADAAVPEGWQRDAETRGLSQAGTGSGAADPPPRT